VAGGGNEKLRQALKDAGLEDEQLADLIHVDVKTVRRWLTGSTPYPRHRTRIARAVGADENQLWPDATPARPPETDQVADALHTAAIYPAATDPAAPNPVDLIGRAQEAIDLLDLTLKDLASDPKLTPLLAEKAAAGCQIRILVAHPESIHLTIRMGETDPGGAVAVRPPTVDEIYATLDTLQPLKDLDGVQVREFSTTPYNAITRADGQILIGLELSGIHGRQAPLLQIDREDQPEVFDRFVGHYEHVWQAAEQTIWPPAATRSGTAPTPTPSAPAAPPGQ
jgi:transcriptional regulator with XRE-family HTH domain